MNIVKIPGSRCWMSALGVVRHLLADRSKLFDGQHFGRIDINRVAVEFNFSLSGAVFVFTDLNPKCSLVLRTHNCRFAPGAIQFSGMDIISSGFDYFERTFISAPPMVTRPLLKRGPTFK